MPVLVIYQFDQSVRLEVAASFRRRLHQHESFRACWLDESKRCLQLPLNTIIANYDDCESAKVVFELEARRDTLLASLETSVFVLIDKDFVFNSMQMCKDTRCEFSEDEPPLDE